MSPDFARVTRSLFVLLSILAWVGAANATLSKFTVRHSSLLYGTSTTPFPDIAPVVGEDIALVRDGSPPLLPRLGIASDLDLTVLTPQLSGFIFVSRKFTEGPSGTGTGVSGSTGAQIAWGTVTGWQVSGTHWCNSEPATLCLIAGDTDEETNSEPPPVSPFYDIGTWIFHGTGFTAIPFVYSRFTTGEPGGNQLYVLRGALSPDGTVPTLPLAGLAVLGGSVVAAGVLARARRRD